MYKVLQLALRRPAHRRHEHSLQHSGNASVQGRGLQHQVASAYIRELQHTSRCDTLVPVLADVRATYAKHVGQDSLDLILAFAETQQVERRDTQAVMLHYDWSEWQLVAGLSWTNTACPCSSGALLCVHATCEVWQPIPTDSVVN